MTKKQTLTSWLLAKPALFSLVCFGFSALLTVLYGLANTYIFNNPGFSQVGLLTILFTSFVLTVILFLVRAPRDFFDRRSFVALSNAQNIITYIIFIVSSILIVANAKFLILYLLWLGGHNPLLFILLTVVASWFYLYLAGIMVMNVYVKYMRCRAMGIPRWKIICSMPFGFAMLWSAGYLLPDSSQHSMTLPLNATWYKKFTNWAIKTPAAAFSVLFILILMSGFLFGFDISGISLCMILLMSTWSMIVGLNKTKQQVGTKFSSVAVIINLIIIAVVLGLFILAIGQTPDIAMTINNSVVPPIR